LPALRPGVRRVAPGLNPHVEGHRDAARPERRRDPGMLLLEPLPGAASLQGLDPPSREAARAEPAAAQI
jgi:hypothetical protein